VEGERVYGVPKVEGSIQIERSQKKKGVGEGKHINAFEERKLREPWDKRLKRNMKEITARRNFIQSRKRRKEGLLVLAGLERQKKFRGATKRRRFI